MGWLFAVALGMQQQKASAVARSLVPIAIGHAVAIGGVVLVAALLGRALPLAAIRYLVAAVLIGLGIHRLVRHRHPRWVRMRVGFRDLVTWSFLMASAHGAGLMVLPVLLGSSAVQAADHMPGHAPRIRGGQSARRARGHRRPHDRVSRGDRAHRVGGLSQVRPRASSHGVVQPRRGVGRRAPGHRRRHARDVGTKQSVLAPDRVITTEIAEKTEETTFVLRLPSVDSLPPCAKSGDTSDFYTYPIMCRGSRVDRGIGRAKALRYDCLALTFASR